MKLSQPYILIQKINDCRDRVLKGLHSNDNRLVQHGVEGIATLIGRCLVEFGSSSDPTFYHKGMVALLDARSAMRQGDNHLKKRTYSHRVDNTRPSEWVSFDGDIKSPLYVARSTIPNAGKGLFCEKLIKQGTVIAPNRIKIQDSGDFMLDWRKFPIAAMVNHHPLPNLSVGRGDRPVGAGFEKMAPTGSETSYLIANRDIGAGEELTSDYRDRGWAEWDYYDSLPLPLESWDRNVLRNMPETNSKLKSVVQNNLTEFAPAAELLGGSALCVISSRSSGWVSALSGLAGIALASHSIWKTNERE